MGVANLSPASAVPLRELGDLQRPPAARIAVVGALGGLEFVEHELERVVMSGRVRRLRPIPSAKASIRLFGSSAPIQARARAPRTPLRRRGARGGPPRSAYRLGGRIGSFKLVGPAPCFYPGLSLDAEGAHGFLIGHPPLEDGLGRLDLEAVRVGSVAVHLQGLLSERPVSAQPLRRCVAEGSSSLPTVFSAKPISGHRVAPALTSVPYFNASPFKASWAGNFYFQPSYRGSVRLSIPFFGSRL